MRYPQRVRIKLVALSLLTTILCLADTAPITWRELPPLPPAPGQATQPGLAGAFSGVHNGVLIVAGGANFPAGWPRTSAGELSPKVYHRDIYVLRPGAGAGASPQWQIVENTLEEGYSYGVSISTPDGIVCIGGEWKEGFVKDPDTGKLSQPWHLSDRVFVLRWDSEQKNVVVAGKLASPGEDASTVRPLPSLPEPCAYIAGGMIGDVIYVAGGNCGKGREATSNFWALDLSKKTSETAFTWEERPTWPASPRWKVTSAVQSDGSADCFYLFSGAGPGGERLTDGWRFNPRAYDAALKDFCRQNGQGVIQAAELGDQQRAAFFSYVEKISTDTDGQTLPRLRPWMALADVGAGGPGIRCVAAAPATGVGANHILVLGGDDGEYYQQAEYNALQVRIKEAEKSGNGETVAAVKAAMEQHMIAHPGFPRDVLAYHTITDTWHRVADFPEGNHVTTNVVKWDGSLIVPSGEIRPGVRSPRVWQATLAVPAKFGAVNYAILVVYLAALVVMGAYFAKREKTTDDFFKAGRRIPWWAAGLSVFGTMLSAITFMACPAKLYATNWLYVANVFLLFLLIPIVTKVFIPFYRRLDVTTAYEYLEKRFNVTTRLFGSAVFLLMQFGRLGIVLLLPSLALSVVTGINVYVCIAVMGVLATVYTVMGGMEAVIWTDVLQVIVLMAGAFISLILILTHVDGGVSSLIHDAAQYGRLECVDWKFDLTTPTIWVLLLYAPGGLIPYASDQAVIQRYLTTKDEKTAANGLWLCALLGLAALVFWAVGTALWGFYRCHPASLPPTLGKLEMIFPWYIVNELPAGVAGLVIAGVFAASMSSLDSSMNSMSAAIVTDFYRRFKANPSEENCLRLAKWMTALTGIIGTVFALVMAGTQIKSIWDQFSMILGLFGGGLAGLFILGMFTRRGNGPGAIVGLIASAFVLRYVKTATSLHFFLYGVVGMASCVIVGWLASFVLPGENRSAGLTIHALRSVPKP